MIIYFSGTGNSEYIAKYISNQINDEIVDITPYIKNNQKAIFNSDSPLIFISPTYGWQLPHIFIDFIINSCFEGNKNAYFIMTCGSEIGNAKKGIIQLCQQKEFNYLGVLEVIMPENYIALFKAPNKTKSKLIINNALKTVDDNLTYIKNNKPFLETESSLIDIQKSGIVNYVFYKYIIKDQPFYATDQCISCNKCVNVCPLNNIQLKDGKPSWHHNCTHCMACISNCPTLAIEYGKRTRNKRRYLCKENI